VRGYRSALLTGQNYGNLTQCENIDGMDGKTGKEEIHQGSAG
jgi:V-type H+-transporting ATPase subunit d